MSEYLTIFPCFGSSQREDRKRETIILYQIEYTQKNDSDVYSNAGKIMSVTYNNDKPVLPTIFFL